MSGPGGSAAGRTVVERRAADVLVLGNSAAASAAAYSLARQGKKVVQLRRLHPSGKQERKEVLRPMHLPSDDATIATTAAEAAAYWRGLQRMSPIPFIQACGSLDLGLLRGQSAAASSLQMLLDATKEAGVRFDLLGADELSEKVPQLKPPNGCGALYQAEGGVLNSIAVEGMLSDLAQRQGVLIRDQLTLQGWKDQDGYFAIRTSRIISPDAESVFEAEQVLLCPGVDDWVHNWHDLFGLASSLQIKQAVAGRCPASTSSTDTPLWRFLGADYAPEQAAAAEPVIGAWGYPLQLQASRIKVAQAPGKGLDAGSQELTAETTGRVGTQLQGVSRMLWRGADSELAAEASTSAHVCTPDGLPVLGFHPSFEEGRLLVAACTSGGSFGGRDGYQFSPLLAKAAANILMGATADVPAPERWSAEREGVELSAVPEQRDTWTEMRTIVSRTALQKEEDAYEKSEIDKDAEEREGPAKQYWMP